MLKGLLIGAAHVDIFADTSFEFNHINGNDLPGTFFISIGGTCFNVCMNLRELGVSCTLVTAGKKGSLLAYLIKHELARLKLNHLMITSEKARDSAFLSIREKGDMVMAITASSWDDMSWKDILPGLKNILKDKHDFCVIDCNVPAEIQKNILELVNTNSVFICATSPAKVVRFFAALNKNNNNGKVKAIFMNYAEFQTANFFRFCPEKTDFTWFVTMGKYGVTVYNGKSKQSFRVKEITEAESFSGVGDAFAAGAIYGLQKGWSIKQAIRLGYAKAVEKTKYKHSNKILIDLVRSTQSLHIDRLTGCLSRSFFEDEKSNMLPSDFSHVMLIDIDFFKKINDTFGHDYGDKVLKKTAEIIKGCIRSVDRLYRYGGEEFMLLLPGISDTDAIKIAERIRETVKLKSEVTVTIGVAPIVSSIEESIKLADISLYEGKNAGRNTVRFAGNSNGNTSSSEKEPKTQDLEGLSVSVTLQAKKEVSQESIQL